MRSNESDWTRATVPSGGGTSPAPAPAYPSGTAAWGSITGNLSDQVDLQAALNALTSLNVVTKTTGYTETATTGVQVRLCNSVAGFTIILPTAVGNKAQITFKNISTGSIVIDGSSGQTIDGAATATIADQYESFTIVSDNSNWWII